MKKISKMLSVLLILIILTSSFVVVNAAGTNQITIENDKSGHTYSAYQIFQGVLSAGSLTDIDWGTGVDGNGLLAELKTNDAFSACTSAEEVAEVLGTFSNDSEALEEFAITVSDFLTSTRKDSVEGTGVYTISGLDDGYYFIQDSLDVSANPSDAISKYIVKVAGADVSLKAKVDLPTLGKTVENVTYNNAAFEEDVEFTLTTKVPEMDGYSSYNFVITDDISTSFTMNDDLTVKIEGTTLEKDVDYRVSSNGSVYTIEFIDMINKKENAGKTIEVTYTAKLNDTATLGNAGNKTTAYLTYSNNPYVTSSNAVSSEISTYTYVTGLKLTKVSSKDSTIKLANAEFTVTKDGATVGTIVTDANGEATILGISEGTYVITENQAPEGYNTLKNPIEIEIDIVYPVDSTGNATINSSIVTNANNSTIITNTTTGVVELTVPNTSGLQLPSTGGVGTVIFMVSGIVLMILAGFAVLATQRSKKQRKY